MNSVPDDTVISGRWVDTQKTPGVHRSNWVLGGMEEIVEEFELFEVLQTVNLNTPVSCSSIFT